MIDKNWHNDGTRPFFSALNEVVVHDGEVIVAYGHLELTDGFIRDAMVGIGATKNMAPATLAHIESLLILARDNQQLTFGQCMETAFNKAKQRSAIPFTKIGQLSWRLVICSAIRVSGNLSDQRFRTFLLN